MIWAILEYEDIEPIILSPSEHEEVSIRQVAEIIAESMGYDKPIIWDTSKSDGQFRKPSSNDKLKSHLPEFKFTHFDKALYDSVQWFINHYEECRK